VHVGEASGALVPGLGICGVGCFVEELHGAEAEAPQRFKGYRAERIPGACAIHVVVQRVSAFRRDAAWPGVRAAEQRYEAARGWMNETSASTGRAGAHVAMGVRACLGAIRVAGSRTLTAYQFRLSLHLFHALSLLWSVDLFLPRLRL
jgi:hypothetical protein